VVPVPLGPPPRRQVAGLFLFFTVLNAKSSPTSTNAVLANYNVDIGR